MPIDLITPELAYRAMVKAAWPTERNATPDYEARQRLYDMRNTKRDRTI